ncbi:MAG: phenylalanine--tRNA ligase subunit beta [Candidatus Paceibacterota bacterium]|jgi:phenylalanyl-tRNA synthetase beta chain
MKISYNWLKTYFDKDIPQAEKLVEIFPLYAFEIEEFFKTEKGDDTVFDVKILPDRAHYALSHKGVAEEVAILTKLPIKERFSKELEVTIKDKPSIKIEDKGFCRRYVARIVELGESSPQELPSKATLEAIGQRSINPIVDATNYVMYDIGQPLHAFDADKVKGSITIRAAKEGEKIVLLDGRELTLTTADHVIADDEGPLVVAGAKGGKRAEISDTTKRIMIESANFEPTAVRKTSTRYDIRSDSSKRFENEITPMLAIHGMNNVCALIKEIYKDAIFGEIVDEFSVKPKQTVIEFNPTYIEERLGLKIPIVEAKEILERMNIKVEETDANPAHDSSNLSDLSNLWKLTIPYERLDLNIKEDIVEEVGRIYGYDKIKGILPPVTKNKVEVLPIYYISEKIKNILADQGFSEVSLYTLVEKGEIETAKPLAKDKAFARTNLADGMFSCLEKNALNADLIGLEAIKIFEIGHIFKKDLEEVFLVIGAVQIKKVKGLKGEQLIKNALEVLNKEIGLDIIKIKFINKGQSYLVEVNISKSIDDIWPKLKDQVDYQHLNFGPTSPNKYQKFSLYPFIVRDIAVFVPESISSEVVWEAIGKGINNANAEELLTRHSLFDVFKKDGKISYAFRMIFQSMERTLTDDEVNGIMEKVNKVMKENDWEVR